MIRQFLIRTKYQGRIDITDIIAWSWLIISGIMILIPVSWAIVSSFKSEAEITRYPPSFLPKESIYTEIEGFNKRLPVYEHQQNDGSTQTYALVKRIGKTATVTTAENPTVTEKLPLTELTAVKKVKFSFSNYLDPIKKFNFFTYLKNTVFITFMATMLTLLLSSMAAFSLSKYEFKGKNVIFLVVLSTLMIPLTIAMVPAFLVVSGLNLTNNLWGVILPTVATPTGVFLLRQYMLTIPNELIEAARVDAAGEFRIFWKVVLPLTAPALAVLAIFSVMWRWNDFLWPLIVLQDDSKRTLQVGLNSFQGEFSTQWHYILAMTVLSLVPVTAVFIMLQKYITTGIAGSGMK